MRNHSHPSHISQDISNCEITGGACLLESHNDLPAGKGYIIESCSFTLTTAYRGNGGSISLIGSSPNHTSTTLTINCCTFSNCVVNTANDDGNGGGAIYVSEVPNVAIYSSLFSSCACYSSNRCDGGAIELWIITAQPLVVGCIFHTCSAADDGGAVSIWYADGNTDIFVCDECRFFSGTAGGAAGCLIVFNCECRTCSNCLFADSSAHDGGAIYTWFSSYPSGRYLGQFCFFKSNSVTILSHGNDIALKNYYPNSTNNPIHQCISTCPFSRVSYYNGGWCNTDENWLPHGCDKFSDQIARSIQWMTLLTTVHLYIFKAEYSYVICCFFFFLVLFFFSGINIDYHEVIPVHTIRVELLLNRIGK